MIRLARMFLKGHMNLISAGRECITLLSLLALIRLCRAALFHPAGTRPGSVGIMKWILPKHAQCVSRCYSKTDKQGTKVLLIQPETCFL